MALDLSKYIQHLEDQANKLGGLAPHKWKANWPPDPHHVDAESIKFSYHIDVAAQKADIRFDYTDGGAAHSVEADLAVAGTPQAPTATWSVVVDGVQQPGQGHVAVVPKVGMEGLGIFYDRLAFEISFTDASGVAKQFRADGDVG